MRELQCSNVMWEQNLDLSHTGPLEIGIREHKSADNKVCVCVCHFFLVQGQGNDSSKATSYPSIRRSSEGKCQSQGETISDKVLNTPT